MVTNDERVGIMKYVREPKRRSSCGDRKPSQMFKMKFIQIIVRIINYILIILGFTYQSVHVCLDYFQYKTITNIKIQDYPPERIIPTILMCTTNSNLHHTNKSIGELFTNDFADNNTLVRAYISKDCMLGYTDNKNVYFRRFIGESMSYCVSVERHNFISPLNWESMKPCPNNGIYAIWMTRRYIAEYLSSKHNSEQVNFNLMLPDHSIDQTRKTSVNHQERN